MLADAISVGRFSWIFLTACTVGLTAGIYAVVVAVDQVSSVVDGEGALPEDAWWYPQELPGGAFVQQLGTWTVTAFALGLITLGVAAWRSEKSRRIVGILWDVLSFWPRAGHPLAPPCYAERAVPQLACRVQHLTARTTAPNTVVLAGHSQGSALAVAAIAQLPRCLAEARSERVALLTYGSPLMRIYAPVFPRIFGRRALTTGDDVLAVLEPQHLRWTNLWRPTDPLGNTLWPMLQPTTDPSAGAGDARLRDPSALVMDAATSAYPRVYGHSHYPTDRLFRAAVAHLSSLLRAQAGSGNAPGPGPHSDPG